MIFLNIDFTVLQADSVYNFCIYLNDTLSKQRSCFYYMSEKFNTDDLETMVDFSKRGAVFQILFDDREIFCQETGSLISELKSQNSFIFEMIAIQEYRQKKYKNQLEIQFKFKSFFQNFISYRPLINYVQAQLALMPLTISEEISLVAFLADSMFQRELLTIKEASLIFVLLKLLKVEDLEIYASAILSSLIKDIGLNQISRSSLFDVKILKNEFFRKHPMLSIYVLSKTNITLTKNTKRFILEHHEVDDGSGYPRGKFENQIDIISHVVRLAHELVNLTEGFYTESSLSWDKSFDIIINKVTIDGFNNNFPQPLIDLLVGLKS